jgi:hypothetical protein
MINLSVSMQNKRPTIAMPPNEVEVKLIFTRRRSAKIMGKLAEAPVTADDDNDDDKSTTATTTIPSSEGNYKVAEPREGDSVRGILVTQQNSSKIVSPEDLSTYTPLRVGSVYSRLHVPFVGKIATLRLFLNEMFRGIEELRDGTNDGENGQEEEDDADDMTVTFSLHGGQVSTTVHRFQLFILSNHLLIEHVIPTRIHNCRSPKCLSAQVKIIAGKTKGIVTVEWDCSSVGDVIADAVVALIMHAQTSAASIRLTGRPCSHRRKKVREGDEEEEGLKKQMEEYMRASYTALKDQFMFVEATYEANRATFEITIDAATNTTKDNEGGVEAGANHDNDDGAVVCNATVEFEDGLVGGTAKITVESEDEKLASNVQVCLQNVAAALAPIGID